MGDFTDFLDGIDPINAQYASSGKSAPSDPYGIAAPFEMNYQPSPQMMPRASDFSDRSPLAQFQSLASEAYHPGSYDGQNTASPSDNGIIWDAPPDPNNALSAYQIPQMQIHNENGVYAAGYPGQQQEDPFRESVMGQVFAGLLPDVAGPIYAIQREAEQRHRGTALSEWARSQAANNPQMAPLVDMMAHDDPKNAQAYIPSLIAAQQGQPELQKRQQIQQYMQSLETGDQPQPQPGAPPQIPASGSPPVGVQNNNFTNIKDSPQNNWQGQTGANGGFAQFATPEDGFRAAAKTMDTYASQGINTIDGLISKWAPKADHNDPDSYANFVSRETGISRGQSINLADPATQAKIINAMQKVEVGPDKAAPADAVQRGVDMASGGAPASPIQAFHNEMTQEEKMAVHIASLDPTPANIAAATQAFGKRGQVTPYTEAGKAADDLKHGLITEDQYQKIAQAGQKLTAETPLGKASLDLRNGLITQKQYDTLAAGSNGLAETGLSGQQASDWLKETNPGLLSDVQMALRGDYPVARGMSDKHTQEVFRAANLIDPSFSPTTYNARNATAKEFSPAGNSGKVLVAINTVASHIGDMQDNFDKLGNSGMWGVGTVYNKLGNEISKSGDNETHTALNKLNQDITAVAPEMAKIYTGTGSPAEGSIKERHDAFNTSDGPDAFHGTLQEGAQLIKDKAEKMLDAYQTQMGQKRPGTLQPFDDKTIAAFAKLGVDIGPVNERIKAAEPINQQAPAAASTPKTVNWNIVNGKLVQQ